MANQKYTYIRVNEPHVVHETIDGEAILLNLGTGNYYSIEWPGTLIWELLSETGDAVGLKDAFVNVNGAKQGEIEKAFDNFVDKLLEEELVINSENGSVSSLEIDKKTKQELEKALENIDKLALNKYSDMRDMLLLDPIHDVDEKGWPEPKKELKKEK